MAPVDKAKLEKRREQNRLSMQRARERLKKDKEKYEEVKKKDRERYHNKKKEGLRPSIKDLSRREQKAKRKEWRENTKRYRQKNKNNRNLNKMMEENSPPHTPEREISHTPTTSTSRVIRRSY